MRKLLASSILLNVMLLGFSGYNLIHTPAPSSAAQLAASYKPNEEGSTKGLQAVRETFHWSQVEAADYPTYIRNLRTIGCPEETIRDIITADVVSLYAQRSSELQSSARRPQQVQPAPLEPVFRRQSQDLSQEQTSLVASLLAALPASDPADASHQAPATRVIAGPALTPTAQSLRVQAPTIVAKAADSHASSTAEQVAPSQAVNTVDSVQSGADRNSTPLPIEPRGKTADAKAKTPRGDEGLFTVEEQQYRALYGWTAFYAAKNEQAMQPVDSVVQ